MGTGTINLWAQNQHKITLNCDFYGITPAQELLYDIRCLIAMLEAEMGARDAVRLRLPPSALVYCTNWPLVEGRNR